MIFRLCLCYYLRPISCMRDRLDDTPERIKDVLRPVSVLVPGVFFGAKTIIILRFSYMINTSCNRILYSHGIRPSGIIIISHCYISHGIDLFLRIAFRCIRYGNPRIVNRSLEPEFLPEKVSCSLFVSKSRFSDFSRYSAGHFRFCGLPQPVTEIPISFVSCYCFRTWTGGGNNGSKTVQIIIGEGLGCGD